MKYLRNFLIKVYDSHLSGFYRKKWHAAGFNPRHDFHNFSDVKKIPFLSKDELRNTSPFKRLYVPHKNVVQVRGTSGSIGGEPIMLFRTLQLLDHPDFYFADCRQPMIAIYCNYPLYSTFMRVDYYARKLKRRTPLMIETANLAGSLKQATELEVDCITGSPQFVTIVLEKLNPMYDLRKIKAISLSGDVSLTSTTEKIKTLAPLAKIQTYYDMAEAGYIAYQCEALMNRGLKMLHPGNRNIIEIVNSAGAETPLNQCGDIVMTKPEWLPTPPIRYQTGDVGSLVESPCDCGKPTFLVHGRKIFQSVSDGFLSLSPTDIEDTLLKFNKVLYCDDFRMEIKNLAEKEYDFETKIHFKKPISRDAASAIRLALMGISAGTDGTTIETLMKSRVITNFRLSFVRNLHYYGKVKRILIFKNIHYGEYAR